MLLTHDIQVYVITWIVYWWRRARSFSWLLSVNCMCLWANHLTHWGRVTHICVSELTNHHWFRQWLVAWPAPSHYLNQCWNIVNWTIGNKFQWNINRNDTFSFKKIHLKMLPGKWRPFCLGLNVLTNTKISAQPMSWWSTWCTRTFFFYP